MKIITFIRKRQNFRKFLGGTLLTREKTKFDNPYTGKKNAINFGKYWITHEFDSLAVLELL